MSTVISIENLGKKYTLRHQQRESYTALRDLMANGFASLGRKLLHPFQSSSSEIPPEEEFWALKDVSFEVKQGDRIGIIGRNGAGKSTLLKILSRITEPTTGRVRIKGRVASLLEVGTGFHPELTGRENIYLNGAILGMSRFDIKKKFDEIVDFAEIEKFLDTPVKRYSSGMYVRLAFAVAAHLEPEILVVDEVLAVGDAHFQKKCLGKMEKVSAKEGRTILFVSHNIGAINALCVNTLYLSMGEVVIFDKTSLVLQAYLGSEISAEYKGISVRSYVLNDLEMIWHNGAILCLEISWQRYMFPPGWECDLACYTLDGIKIFAFQSQNIPGFSSEDKERNCVEFLVENPGFSMRQLRVDIGMRNRPNESYSLLMENCLLLSPDGRDLPSYKREDVIIVPKVRCLVSSI